MGNNNYTSSRRVNLHNSREVPLKRFYESQQNPDSREDLFVEVSTMPCITGPMFVLNDRFRKG